MSDSADPWAIGHQASLSWDFPGKNYGVGCISFSRDLPNPGIEPSSFMPPASELLLLRCSSLYQGRAQVGCTGHLLQAHKPEVTHSIIFKYCRSDKKRNGGEGQLAEAEAGCRLAPPPHGDWGVNGDWQVELCQGFLTSLVRHTSVSGGWLCFPCGCAHSSPSSARFKIGFHNQSPIIHLASANPNQTRRFCQI